MTRKLKASGSVVAALPFFEKFSEHCLAALETAREAGTPIAGVYCIYAPLEVIRAAGCVPIGLCGKRQEPIQAAEAVLPASLCPLIKSSYGYAKTDTCPFSPPPISSSRKQPATEKRRCTSFWAE